MLSLVFTRTIGRRTANNVVALRLCPSILSVFSPYVKFALDSGSRAVFATVTKGSSDANSRPTRLAPRAVASKGNTTKVNSAASKTRPATKKKDARPKTKPKRKAAARKAEKAKIEYTKPPKRPLTPYMLYLREQKAGIAQRSIEGNMELVKQVSEKWRHLSPEEKLPYKRQFAEAREKHAQAREAWLKSLSPNGLRQYRSAVRKRHLRSRPKDAAGRPLKRAPSAWNLFSKDAIARKLKSGEKVGVHLAAIGTEWRQLSDSEKAEYTARAAGKRITYEQAKDKQRDEARSKFYKVHNLRT